MLEHSLVYIGAGVAWLKTQAGAEIIVLLGNSGGGSLMAAYQFQALGVTMLPTLDKKIPEALHALPMADYYVPLCAHGGRPEVLTAWFDPAVADENSLAASLPHLICPTQKMVRNTRQTLWPTIAGAGGA